MVRRTRFTIAAAFALLALPGFVLAQTPSPMPPMPAIAPMPPMLPMQPLPPLGDMVPLPVIAPMPELPAFMFAFAQGPKPVPAPGPGPMDKARLMRGDNEDRNYQNGTRALDGGRWDEAVENFTRVVNQNGTRADGAMYWIAWAQNKQGNGAAALEWLERMRKSFAESRWIGEARALEVEIRQRAGQPVRPENVPDDELRLMALNSLARADEQRAVPMLEKIVSGTGSPRLKERALYVLAQNGSPEARQVVIRIARGGNPDLQARAVQHLGAFGGADSKQVLLDIYKSSNNVAVKRTILRSFMQAGDREQLLEVAKAAARTARRGRAAARRHGCAGAALAALRVREDDRGAKANHSGDVCEAQPGRADPAAEDGNRSGAAPHHRPEPRSDGNDAGHSSASVAVRVREG